MLRELVAWFGPSSPNVAVEVQPAAQEAALHFIHVDHLNTPRLVADAAGTTVWKWDQQEPFGVNVADEDPDSNSMAFEFPLRFPGQYADKETNLRYNHFRDYDQRIGRYGESDPIGLNGGLNTYAYVGSQPLRFTDATGQLLFLAAVPLAGSGSLTGAGTAVLGGLAVAAILSVPSSTSQPTTGYGSIVHNPGKDECGKCNACVPPAGTQCYFGPDTEKPHAGVSPHWHLWEMRQNPRSCDCFWNDLGGKVGVGVVGALTSGIMPCPFPRP
jgi:RHS repeat-associated protein